MFKESFRGNLRIDGQASGSVNTLNEANDLLTGSLECRVHAV